MKKFYLGSMPVILKKVVFDNFQTVNNGRVYQIVEENYLYGKNYLCVNFYSLTQSFISNHLGANSKHFLNNPFYAIYSDLVSDNRIIALMTIEGDIHIIEDYNKLEGNNIVSRYGENYKFIEYYSGLLNEDFKTLLFEEGHVRKLKNKKND